MKRIPAITLWQPWASLISLGIKEYETRSWRCPMSLIGKEFYIHVAKRQMQIEERELLCHLSQLDEKYEYLLEKQFPYGALVAKVKVEKCLQMSDRFHEPDNEILPIIRIDSVSDQERLCGDWQDDRYAWKLTDVEEISPIPMKGGQRIWYPTVEVRHD